LKEVVAAVTELKIFDIVNFEDHAAYKALGVAEYHIKNCFAAFGVGISAMQTYHFLIASPRAAR
jgi:hypothetical protein